MRSEREQGTRPFRAIVRPLSLVTRPILEGLEQRGGCDFAMFTDVLWLLVGEGGRERRENRRQEAAVTF